MVSTKFWTVGVVLRVAILSAGNLAADSIPAAMLDPNLQVTTYVINAGSISRSESYFIRADDCLVLEKASRAGQACHSVASCSPIPVWISP